MTHAWDKDRILGVRNNPAAGDTAAVGVALAHAREALAHTQQLADGLAALLRQTTADRDVAERNSVELERQLRGVAGGDEPLAEWEYDLPERVAVRDKSGGLRFHIDDPGGGHAWGSRNDGATVAKAERLGDELGQVGREAAIDSAARVLVDHDGLEEGGCRCGWNGIVHEEHVAAQLWAVGLLTDTRAGQALGRLARLLVRHLYSPDLQLPDVPAADVWAAIDPDGGVAQQSEHEIAVIEAAKRQVAAWEERGQTIVAGSSDAALVDAVRILTAGGER